MNSKFLYLALATVTFTSCVKDDNPEPVVTPPTTATDYIVVGNEGAFGGETASLTVINREDTTLNQNVFAEANNGAVLGDVLQSMNLRNGEIYLVVNNSGKIEVVDTSDFSSKRIISGFASPRYMHFASDSKAYVSNLFANRIDVIDPVYGTFTNSIATSNYIEKMKQYNGELWCTAPGSDKLYFLNLSTDQISDSLTLSLGVSEIGMDGNNDFWILAQSTYSTPSIEPAIYHIDGDSKEILGTFIFPTGTGYGGILEMSADKESVLYVMGGELFKMSISASVLPDLPFISKFPASFYALNVNPDNGEIALTDALDFSQGGHVNFYTSEGQMIDDYETGVGPHSVLWVKK